MGFQRLKGAAGGWAGSYPIVSADIANAAVTFTQAGAGVFKQLASTTLASAVTEIEWTGLDLAAQKYILIEYAIVNAQTGYLDIYFNEDSTDTNYYSMKGYLTAAGMNGAYAHAPYLARMINGNPMNGYIWVQRNGLAANNTTALDHHVREPVGAGIGLEISGVSWVTTDNVTKITLHCDGAGGLGVGSKFHLFGWG